jgi:hypothetical protein
VLVWLQNCLFVGISAAAAAAAVGDCGMPDNHHSLAACVAFVPVKFHLLHNSPAATAAAAGLLLQPQRGALVAEICDALTASETVPSTIMWTL